MSSRFLSVCAVGVVGLVVASACGSDGGSEFGSSGGSSGFGGSSSGNIGSSGGSSGDIDALNACATETLKGEALPLDMYIMLDRSGSMASQTGTGTSKWVAVRTALKAFISDPKSAGIGVGLQVFPIIRPGAPASCTSDTDCGAHGPCGLKACDTPPYPTNPGGSPPLLPCAANTDCPNNAACLPFAQCGSAAHPGVCLKGGATAWGCGNNCKNAPAVTQSVCVKQDCFLDDYDDARVPVGMLPGASPTLTSAIDDPNLVPADSSPQTPLRNEDWEAYLTPTSAALSGAVTYAKAYAAQNPSHAVVVVLATDGLPTRCPPYDSGSIGAIAASGVNGTPGVKTFVVGVFADVEKQVAQANLDDIAKGGGTGSALIVSTSGDVTKEFQAAMDKIRGAALPCDYKVPQPQSGTPDFGRVNVKFTDAGGTASVFPQAKGGASACDANGGWYYDVDPATGTPTKITLCPASCDKVKGAGGGSKVDVLLGCVTIVK